jgi:branched-subunit amino acid aminotransferase/4-amino-4-deoxychorismate lyase
MAKAVFNGKIIDKSEAKISIDDKGYFFDFAVYSSIKVIKGRIFFPEYHVSRLFESARFMDLEHKFKKEDVISWIHELIKANNIEDALLKIILIGDPDGKGGEKLFIFSVGGLTFYPDKFYTQGVKVITYKGERFLPKGKTKDMLMSFFAHREAGKKDAMDALLVDRDGNIREGTRTNFFAIKGNEIITAPADDVLEGITKKILLKAVKGHFSVKEEKIPFINIKNYEEFFLTSTSMNVMPIKQIDELPVSGRFEKTRIIIKLFKEYSNSHLVKDEA